MKIVLFLFFFTGPLYNTPPCIFDHFGKKKTHYSQKIMVIFTEGLE